MKDRILSVSIGLVIGLLLVILLKGALYTYYAANDITHSFETKSGRGCTISYDFFDKEMDCYILDKEQK